MKRLRVSCLLALCLAGCGERGIAVTTYPALATYTKADDRALLDELKRLDPNRRMEVTRRYLRDYDGLRRALRLGIARQNFSE